MDGLTPPRAPTAIVGLRVVAAAQVVGAVVLALGGVVLAAAADGAWSAVVVAAGVAALVLGGGVALLVGWPLVRLRAGRPGGAVTALKGLAFVEAVIAALLLTLAAGAGPRWGATATLVLLAVAAPCVVVVVLAVLPSSRRWAAPPVDAPRS